MWQFIINREKSLRKIGTDSADGFYPVCSNEHNSLPADMLLLRAIIKTEATRNTFFPLEFYLHKN